MMKNDPRLKLKCESIENSKTTVFSIGDDSNLYFRGRLCIPDNMVLKQNILSEAHSSAYSIHSGLLIGESRASGTVKFVTTYEKSRIEVGVSHNDAIWVVVDRLTKSTHFIPVKTKVSLERLAELYIFEIVRLHGASLSIISDQDQQFTSRFWNKLHKVLAHDISSSDGWLVRTSSWEKFLPLTEFAYNNSYQTSIKMAPYEALYERKSRNPLDKVFLKVSPWRKVLQIGKKGKLSPRFIGSYKILEKIRPIAYRLPLPPELEKVHNIFHVSKLRHYRSDSSHVKELQNKRVPLVKVLWPRNGNEEATFETEELMKSQYLNLFSGNL
ncbi:DNA/RNA polymerases superfamily protein [Gossypium australe]|uniref:DNA/RNA polymerases superfamily protein n=1 Tax=Gossypium australe TaxID=47621 RepID=A0A5B6VAR6_9ROSI|nr:DNA/RNA polymerases superfamily protein [Gossypium australe]